MASGNITIASSGTTSTAVAITDGAAAVVLQLPSALTGTALAVHGSADGTNFYPIYVDGTALSITHVNSSIHSLNPRATVGLLAIKLVSNGTEAAERTIGVVVQKVA